MILFFQVFTFTKSLSSGSTSTVPTSLTSQQAKALCSKAVSSEFHSKQNVALVKTTGSQSNQSDMSVCLKNKSEDSVDKSSSTITLKGHTSKASLSQCKKQARTTCASSGPVNMQDVSLTENFITNPIPQARLPGANMPLTYQQFANPLHGQSCYHPNMTGPTVQPLLPWTPVHYIPGFLPSYNLGFVGHQTRPASVSGIDNISLDLSIPRTNTGMTPTYQVETKVNDKALPGTRRGTKRCASTTCIPSQNEELRQKVKRLSSEVPIFISRKNGQPVTTSCQSFSTTSTGYYLHESLNKDSRFGSQLNSLQALQELTSRICSKPEAVWKSLSTSSIPQTQTHKGQRLKEKNNYDTGGTLSVSGSQRSMDQNHHLTATQSGAQNIFLAYKDLTVSVNSKTSVPLSTACLQKCVASPVESNLSFSSQEKSVLLDGSQLHSGQTVTNYQPSGMTESVLGVSSSFYPNTCISHSEKFDISFPLDTHCNSPDCQKNFQYSQQVQVPYGKYSYIDFPALLSKTYTESQSSENFLSAEKENTEVKKFSCQPDCIAENIKTTEDQIVTIDRSKINKTGNASLYLEKDYIICPKKIAENQNSSLAVLPEVSSTEGEIDPEATNAGKTCLIIQTTSENGTEQVQFKLDKQRSASLLSALLKLKPVKNNLACVQTDSCNTSGSMHQRKVIALHYEDKSADGNVVQQNKTGDQKGCNQTKHDPISVPEETFGSFNVSPYLLGMLPDTTSFSDTFDDNVDDDYFDDDCDDDDEEEEKVESYSDEDDDVFLHPIY